MACVLPLTFVSFTWNSGEITTAGATDAVECVANVDRNVENLPQQKNKIKNHAGHVGTKSQQNLLFHLPLRLAIYVSGSGYSFYGDLGCKGFGQRVPHDPAVVLR